MSHETSDLINKNCSANITDQPPTLKLPLSPLTEIPDSNTTIQKIGGTSCENLSIVIADEDPASPSAEHRVLGPTSHAGPSSQTTSCGSQRCNSSSSESSGPLTSDDEVRTPAPRIRNFVITCEENHLKSMGPCGQKFHKWSDFLVHSRYHACADRPIYVCKEISQANKPGLAYVCGKEFNSRRELVLHAATHLPSQEPWLQNIRIAQKCHRVFICMFCGKEGRTTRGMLAHQSGYYSGTSCSENRSLDPDYSQMNLPRHQLAQDDNSQPCQLDKENVVCRNDPKATEDSAPSVIFHRS